MVRYKINYDKIKGGRYFCVNPWTNDISKLCDENKVLGYSNINECIFDCPTKKSRLWELLIKSHKLLYPNKYNDEHYDKILRISKICKY